ncbi:ATP-binding cassette domain-containing protein [Flavihumibacter sp. R14]|nr:ATP-binding cassette domain-containing protein [Flavihumibacter soli]
MLEIDSVSLIFWGHSVLSGCYLNCAKGEIVGLLGRNGSGKSSLLKIIFGSLKADFKHLRIGGRIIPTGYLTGQIAYLPQQHFMLPFLKVSEIIETFSPFIKEHLLAEEILTISMESRLNDLSNGQQRFLECLWILSRDAKYILLDEPFSAIAPIQIEFLQKMIVETGRDKAVILTDHIYRPLLAVSSRVVLLHNNAVYNIKSADDLVIYNYIPDVA